MDTPTSGPGSILLRERYRPTELIARGGMASVFRARDEQLDRDVAVKIFQATAPGQIEVGKQELKVLASLTHHALVPLLDAGVDHSTPDDPHIFLVMEYVQGTDLRRKLLEGPLSPRQVAYFGFDLAEGLEYIHSRDVVHRDVKPANVLLVEYSDDDVRPRAKLTDFGIAVFSGAQEAIINGRTVGTAAYLSPEQARGEPVTPASDVYSLGLVLLEALTGELAFPGQPLESVSERLARDPRIPDTLPFGWDVLLSAMTAREPADRPRVRDVIVSLRSLVVEELGKHRAANTQPMPVVVSSATQLTVPAILTTEQVSVSQFPTAEEREEARLAAVKRYGSLDGVADSTIERVAGLAARLLGTPVALVSSVERDVIRFRTNLGLDLDEVPRQPGLCSTAIERSTPLVIEDTHLDPRSRDNQLTLDSGMRFYAGAPLRTREGFALGTLCVLDATPRTFSADDIATLEDLAALVMNDLELRLDAQLAGRTG
ncbi:GAF domain-containing protein [Glaciihabitans arcticus]|uniref:non-specific serine/threonine protein kinase n=1 Tax=Glaciihabitans arcticus TaxID=2668039 RepID=A0A4Q9GMQ8_9MICO|nr:GAF domain-containing serine/threonine-protein kinase [Glaciihabitans arcticus]TBN56072.1 GAF domain-containing protein [Glaciihabitans arcticus]